MHHGAIDHVHTLEETIHEDETLLFHLIGEHEPAGIETRGRRSSINSDKLNNSNWPRKRRTSRSVSKSRVREIKDGKIIQWGCEAVLDARQHWDQHDKGVDIRPADNHHVKFSDSGGRTLADPKGFKLLAQRLSRLYSESTDVLKLISVFVAGILATSLWARISLYSAQHSWPGLASTSATGTEFHSTSSLSSRAQSLGTTVHLADVHYFVPGKAKHSLPLTGRQGLITASSDLFPLTIVSSSEDSLDATHISNSYSKYAAIDDVWNLHFTETLLLHYNGSTPSPPLSPSFKHKPGCLYTYGYESSEVHQAISLAHQSKDSVKLLPGPYFARIQAGHLQVHEAWRLYVDTERAFFYGTVPQPDEEDAFAVLPTSHPDSVGLAALAVPSRLYYAKTIQQPLAGVRVSVKDLYDLKGTKTSMGSRAWLNLYPAATSTAPCIQRLIDLGAIIVGKTRLSQFATGQYGTADNVDFGVPFNVRGDGYQEPSSSSSGSGSSAGAYDFIDLAVGSDTGGSVRAPAGLNGVYGNRPSQGAVDLSGSLPLSSSMDTAALLAYDAKKFAQYSKAFYGGNETFKSFPRFPKQLLYFTNPQVSLIAEDTRSPNPGFFPAANEAAALVYETFIQSLEHFLDIRREEIDFYSKFHNKFGMYPAEYIGPAWSLLTAHDQWTLFARQFEEDYKAAHEGDRPFVDPPVRRQWDYASSSVSQEDSEFYLARKEHFQHFVESDLLQRNDSDSCSNALAIFPLSDGSPHYKSDYHLAGQIFNGFNKYSISQLSQVPEIVIPIGEVPYHSKITNSVKYLPVSISILAASGCDFVLYDLVEALAEAGIIRSARPGTSRTF